MWNNQYGGRQSCDRRDTVGLITDSKKVVKKIFLGPLMCEKYKNAHHTEKQTRISYLSLNI